MHSQFLRVVNFYSHAPCGARRNSTVHRSPPCQISTHTPLAGRDPINISFILLNPFLLTRPSRGATEKVILGGWILGISTHTPLAGRDLIPDRRLRSSLYFYSHAPRGARHTEIKEAIESIGISTHTPLAGRDKLYLFTSCHHQLFLLTRPSRGATQACGR